MTVVERVVEVPVVRHDPPRRDGWPALLSELARQIDQGRIYRRDLPSLDVALNEVRAAFRRANR